MPDWTAGCCEAFDRLDFTKASVWPLDKMETLINWRDPNLYFSISMILLKPIYWTLACRLEYHTRTFSKAVGSNYKACVLFGISILIFGVFRDSSFKVAIDGQPKLDLLDNPMVDLLGTASIVIGSILVLTSFWHLGFVGTFQGDYFGIYHDGRITTFPYNLFDNPMYVGTVLNFLAFALWSATPAGLCLSALVGIVYRIVVYIEEPFTAEIYRRKAEEDAKRK